MTPAKPPRTNCKLTSANSACDIAESIYEDPDASMPALTDGSQSEVKVKPVPLPRSKSKPNLQYYNNNTVDSVDESSNAASSQNNESPAGHKRPRPVRPPPRPPMTSSKLTAAVDGSSLYNTTSNTEPNVTPPAISEKIPLPPPRPLPERPPLPSTYYNTQPSAIPVKSQSDTEESQQTRHSSTSSMRHTPVSPAPRTMTRPPPPTFSPPPPPSIRRPSESMYSEIEYPYYLQVLPEDDDGMNQGRSTLRFGEYQRGCVSSRQQTTEDTEDMKGLLRWLKRVSASDQMAPSLYGLSIEEEIRSFNHRAMNVKQALRLYNLLMMKRNEVLRDQISEFTSISDSLDKVQKKSKTLGIAGGTTGAVGGVTAVVGIALAPMTMGVSLIATAVGAGMVASAGGMGAHTAKVNKKIVNRKTVEKQVNDYMANIVDMEHCLDFILTGMNELRRHDLARLQRAGAQPDAMKMAHLSQSVFRSNMNNSRRTSAAHTPGMSSERLLQAFAKEMDLYFKVKDDQKLKQSNKSKFSGRVRLLAQNLQDELDHLNHMWEMFC